MGLFSALKSGTPKVKKVKEEGCVVTLEVLVPPKEVEDQSQTALMRLQHLARIPGFRAGKAPIDLIKQHFSGRAREEAFDALIRKHVPAALADLKLRVVETPIVSDVKWKNGDPLVLAVRVEVAPTPTAKDYLKIPVVRKALAADEAALLARIEELREAHARLDVAKDETVGDTNFVVIDYAAFRFGAPLTNVKGAAELIDMSAEQTIAGLAAGLKGAKRGESKSIPVKLGGKDTELQVTVTEIKTKILPPADAEFAKDLGFETLEDLKVKLKEVLDRETKAASEADIVRQIEEALLKTNLFPLPPSMVERQLTDMIDRMSRQIAGGGKLPEKVFADLRAKLQPKAEDAVRLAFVISAIAEKEKIAATDAELASELEAGLKDAKDEAQKKDLVEIFAKRRDEVAHMIAKRKTLNFLKDKAVYKDA